VRSNAPGQAFRRSARPFPFQNGRFSANVKSRIDWRSGDAVYVCTVETRVPDPDPDPDTDTRHTYVRNDRETRCFCRVEAHVCTRVCGGCGRSTRFTSSPPSRFFLSPPLTLLRRVAPSSEPVRADSLGLGFTQSLHARGRGCKRVAVARILGIVERRRRCCCCCSLLLPATDQMVDGTTHLAPTFVRNAPSRREAVYASSFAFARVLRFVDVQPRSLESARKVQYADNDVAFRFLRISRSRRHLCIIIATD